MKKKTYEQPQLSIIEVKAADIICTSQFPTLQNERYDEVEDVTNDWFSDQWS